MYAIGSYRWQMNNEKSEKKKYSGIDFKEILFSKNFIQNP